MPAAPVRFALLSLLVSMLPACSRDAPPEPSSTPDNFAREWLGAWNSHDVDRLLTYYAGDALYEDVPFVESRKTAPSSGHQMIRAFLTPMFEEMPDLGFELVSASGAGDRMVVEWVMTGTEYREFSGSFSVRGVSLIEFKEDKIASQRDYYDLYLLLSQLGMVRTLRSDQPETGGAPAIQ